MQYLVFDIPDGTSLLEFLEDISCDNVLGNKVSPEIIAVLLKESQNAHDYYIKTCLIAGGKGKMNLDELTVEVIIGILFFEPAVFKEGQFIIQNSMIFKHKS